MTAIKTVLTVLAGTAILYTIGHCLGWWVTGAIVVVGLGYTLWCAIQLWPWRAK